MMTNLRSGFCCYVFLLAALSRCEDAVAVLAVLTRSERLRLGSDAAVAALGSERTLGG